MFVTFELHVLLHRKLNTVKRSSSSMDLKKLPQKTATGLSASHSHSAYNSMGSWFSCGLDVKRTLSHMNPCSTEQGIKQAPC